MIVDCDLIADPNEHTQTLATVDRIEENFGKKPEALLADTAHGTGKNLAGMQQRNVLFFTPMESSRPQEGNPARRDDPTQPVAEADWPQLPRNAQKQYEPLREEMAARMQTAEGRTTYKHRMHGSETPFAHIKQVMGVRQFLLRGLENVRTEWRWVSTAFNLQKLLRRAAAVRAELLRGAAAAVA
jgi:hypothetical protein